MSQTINMHLFMYSISLPVLEHPPPNNKQGFVLLISVGFFIGNFQHFVHSAIHVSSSGEVCMVKSIFISAAGI